MALIVTLQQDKIWILVALVLAFVITLIQPAASSREQVLVMRRKHDYNEAIIFFRLSDSMMCGTTCLQMICKYYGKNFSQAFLSSICYATTEGISMLGIKEAAEKFGIKTIGF